MFKNSEVKMMSKINIINEGKLRSLVKEMIKKENEKIFAELNLIKKYIEKSREDIIILQGLDERRFKK